LIAPSCQNSASEDQDSNNDHQNRCGGLAGGMRCQRSPEQSLRRGLRRSLIVYAKTRKTKYQNASCANVSNDADSYGCSNTYKESKMRRLWAEEEAVMICASLAKHLSVGLASQMRFESPLLSWYGRDGDSRVWSTNSMLYLFIRALVVVSNPSCSADISTHHLRREKLPGFYWEV